MGEIPDSIRLMILVGGSAVSALLMGLGYLIAQAKMYHLISGYNAAPPEIQAQYDIEGLAKHSGNGLITIAVFFFTAIVLLYFGYPVGFIVALFLALSVVALVLLGAPKFYPEQQNLEKAGSADAKHPILRRILPAAAYKAIEAGTRQWEQKCSDCGHGQDFWEAGGVRYKATGEPSTLSYCEACQKMKMHKIRKKAR